jgi:hypothetical protein
VFAERMQILWTLQRLRAEKRNRSLRWFGKSRYNAPSKNTSPRSSALSDSRWRPVPFNGPISCRERTRGIYRLQGVAAGYGACVLPSLVFQAPKLGP